MWISLWGSRDDIFFPHGKLEFCLTSLPTPTTVSSLSLSKHTKQRQQSNKQNKPTEWGKVPHLHYQ